MPGRDALLVERVNAVDLEALIANFEGGSRVEAIQRHDDVPSARRKRGGAFVDRSIGHRQRLRAGDHK